MTGKATRGECTICGKELGKRALTRHLQAHIASGEGEPKGKGHVVTMVHLLVDTRHGSEYWMHVMARGDATLANLDSFLREEWLECCDHMSQFKVGGRAYTSQPDFATWGEGDMDVALADVLGVGQEFTHEYDFGSTTTLRLRVMGTWQGIPGTLPIKMLARNEPPERPCIVCGRPADIVCVACYEGPHGTVLCDACAEGHDCDEDYRLPVVNSPRCGVCGYTGTAW